MNWAASLWLAIAFGNCILAIILATYLHTSIPKWVAAYRYQGRHRGVYQPPVERISLWNKEMVYLGDVMWNATLYGVISDSEPAMMTATLKIPDDEPRLYDDEWYGPMDFGVPPGLPCRPELGPYEYREHFA